MATGKVIVSVVDVGQGQCTFVEIYNTASKLIHALLFDCGSDKTSDETTTNLDYVAAQALKLDTPGFDCIFFSHSDKDHISLTRKVLDKIWETKKPVVKQVIFGGDWDKYTKNYFNILNYIADNDICPVKKIYRLTSDYTNYSRIDGNYNGDLWESTDFQVAVFGIAGNVLSNDPDWDEEDDLDVVGKTAEALNRVSIICGLYFADASYVICGDATNVTMAAVGNLFSDGTTVFHNNIMTTLPHHGSRATGFAVKSADVASTQAIKVVDTFAGIVNSQIMTVSAYAKHRHPSLQLMNRFIPTQTSPVVQDARFVEKNAHRITANIDIDLGTSSGMTIARSNDYSFESQINTFSTYYFDGTPTFAYKIGTGAAAKSQGTTKTAGPVNTFASWKFTSLPNGTATLAGYANLSAAQFTQNPTVLGRVAKGAKPKAKPKPSPPSLENTVLETPRIVRRAPGAAAVKPPVLNGLKHFR